MPQTVIRFSTFEATPAEAKIVGVRPDGSGQGSFDTLPGHPWGPKLSPDGTRLLFSGSAPTSTGLATDLNLNGTGSPDIWIAQADGSQARQLIGGPGAYNGWTWSPDGNKLAFASNREGSWDIYTMTANGGGLTRLTMSPAQDGWPSWTPDGATIVFASTRSDQAQLYSVGTRGGTVQRLLASATADTEPAVASDGKLAFSAQAADGTGAIVILDRPGAVPRILTQPGGLNTAPTWSPDNTQLAFIGYRGGRSDLFRVKADGSGLQQLTTTGQNQRPDWGIAPVDTLTLLMQQHIFQAIDRLQAGTIDATSDDGRGTQTTIQARFDLGENAAQPRLQRVTTRRGSNGDVIDQEIIIGDKTWQRHADQPWQPIANTSGVSAEVRELLPQIELAQQLTADYFSTQVELRWTAPNGTNVILLANVLGGTPIQMRVIDRKSGTETLIRYTWESPGDIVAPIGP